MAFRATTSARGKRERVFDSLGEPEVLNEGPLFVTVGDSTLFAHVTHGGSRLFVHLDESEGVVVRPLGEDVEEFIRNHGLTGVEIDARLLQHGRQVVKLLDSDEEGTVYQYTIAAVNPGS